jgi:beta-lactamase regulating signal transducer with metallopeptidase domain
MPGEVFYLILNMSLASCFIIAALLLLQLFKPLTRRFSYPVWALAFFRLTVPFALSSRWSLFNFTGGLVKRLVTIETITYGTVPAPEAGNLSIMNMIGAAESYVPIEYKTETWRRAFIISSNVWAIIAAVLLLAACILYILTRKELNKAINIRDNIYYSDMLLSPVLVGVLRPRIILPEGLDPDSTEGMMILAHENVHRRRLDNLWRTLAIGIACVHWFNPLVWLMLKMFFRDMELSCDEAVLRSGRYSSSDCRDYASVLLRFADDKRLLISSAFGRSCVKVRILNVLNYKKITVAGAAASAVLLLALALILITNPSLRG